LTWSRVDLDEGIVRLEPGETKNEQARSVYLDEELKEVFLKQRELRKNRKKLTPYVFTNEDGTDRVNDYRKSWGTACKEAKLGRKLFHDLRRTAVRNMIRAGVPERLAIVDSGHRTRSVFERHNIVNCTDLRLAGQRQEEYLKSQMGTISGTIAVFGQKKEVRHDG
jgi:integrase